MVARSAWARARYRARQLAWGWRERLAPEQIEQIRALLTPAELRLFVAMDDRDQLHSHRLLRGLLASAPAPGGAEPSRALLAAALLHDVGKGKLATRHRVAYVLLNAAAPRLTRRLERPDGAAWRGALWRLRHHARLGAERLAASGSAPRVIALVAGHTSPPGDDGELAWMIAVDADS